MSWKETSHQMILCSPSPRPPAVVKAVAVLPSDLRSFSHQLEFDGSCRGVGAHALHSMEPERDVTAFQRMFIHRGGNTVEGCDTERSL
jgi:hypothetical protein